MVSLLLISIPVGFVGSLTGLGGASILIPILVFFGLPIKRGDCIGPRQCHSYIERVSVRVRADRLVNIKIAMYLEMFTSVGAIIGATITMLIAPVYLYFFFALFLMTSFLNLKHRSSPNLSLARHIRLSRWLELEGSYFDEARKEAIASRKLPRSLLQPSPRQSSPPQAQAPAT